MVNVLHIMGCSNKGGISTVVLNYYKHIDRNKVHFDILLTSNTIGANGKELQKLGSSIFLIQNKSKGIRLYEKELTKILKTKKYDAIHVHENETSYVALRIAKKCGVRCRIAHSHTSSPSTSIIGEIKRISGCFLNYIYATKLIACGELAGARVFGKMNMKSSKAIIIPNAIDTKKFKYNYNYRKTIREKLLVLNNEYLVGMVGRLGPEKNIYFILETFRKIHLIDSNIKLVITGDGPERRRLEKYIIDFDMSSYVFLIGNKDDIYKYYSAFDLFVLPSIHEGFPLVVVEAISTGLKTFLSSNITSEFSVFSGVKYIPLASDVWVNKIVDRPVSCDRENGIKEIINNRLDINDTSRILQDIYMESKFL